MFTESRFLCAASRGKVAKLFLTRTIISAFYPVRWIDTSLRTIHIEMSWFTAYTIIKKNDLLLLFKWIFREYISVLIQFQNKHIWFFASCSWIYQWFARAIFLFYINLSVSCRVSICKILFLMSSPFEKKPVF